MTTNMDPSEWTKELEATFIARLSGLETTLRKQFEESIAALFSRIESIEKKLLETEDSQTRFDEISAKFIALDKDIDLKLKSGIASELRRAASAKRDTTDVTESTTLMESSRLAGSSWKRGFRNIKTDSTGGLDLSDMRGIQRKEARAQAQNAEIARQMDEPAAPREGCAATERTQKVAELQHGQSDRNNIDIDIGSMIPRKEKANGAITCAGSDDQSLEGHHVQIVGTGPSGMTRQTTATLFKYEMVRHADTYKVQESVWEMVVVIGTGWTSPSGDIQLAVAFLVNLVIQVILGILFYKLFSNTDLFDIDVTSLEKWRVTAAHDFNQVDSIARETLVTRICRNDATLGIYTNYVNMLQDIRVYDEPLGISTVGLVLCSIVVLVWVFTVADDVLDCIGFLHGISCVPRGRETKLGRVSHHEDALELEFQQISSYRLAFICLACTLRALIAFVFLLIGCEWLAHTYDFADLLLNGVALAFVFKLDELCFDILVPVDVITVCGIMKPLSLEIHKITCIRRFPNVNSSDVSRVPLLTVAMIIFVYICVVHIAPRTTMLREAEQALCGGKRNFATGYDARTKLLYTAPTTSGFAGTVWPDGEPTEVPIIRALTDVNNYLSVAGVAHMAGVEDLRQNVQMHIHTMVEEIYHTCKDVDFADVPSYMLPTIQRHNSNPSATTCEGLKNDCFQLDQLLLRMNCPISCGAASPRSGLFLDTPPRGIPQAACRKTLEYQDALAAIECKDLSPQELSQQPGWAPGWNLMLTFWQDRSTQQRKDCHQIVANLFEKDGCDAVAKLSTLSCLGDDFTAFCKADDDVLNVAMFCPVACGCKDGTNPASACPTQCNQGNATR